MADTYGKPGPTDGAGTYGKPGPTDGAGTYGKPGPTDGAGTSSPAEMSSPYWRLDETSDHIGAWQAIRRMPAATRPAIRMIWQAAPGHAIAIAVLQLASGGAAAFGLLATTGVLERLLAAGPTAQRVLAAVPALALVVAAYALRGTLDAGAALAQARLRPEVRTLAEARLVEAGLGVELSAFDDARFYDRLHRARDRSLFYLERSVDNLVELIGTALTVAAAATSLAVLHPVLLPVLLLSVLPEGWAVLRAARLGYTTMTRTVTLDRRVLMLAELATEREPAAEIRATQARQFLLDEYRQVADLLRDQEVAVGLAQARARVAGRALTGVALGVTFVLLGLLLSAGWIPLAVAGTAVLAIRSAFGALGRLVQAANQLFEQGLYVADYEAFLTDARSRRRAGGHPAPVAPATISLRAVGFRYPGQDVRPALRGIDLTVHAGQTVALVGENGSGKTTLAKIIAGLYRPTGGRVDWDGVDVAQLDPDSVADRVMMVFQEPLRWPHTARINVRIGRHDRSDPGDRTLREAARLAGADRVVEGLPRQWETLLSTYFRDGQDLSGGQWQRLAVARGLFRDAPVLIWDEPTAPLDAKAEYAVYESLRRIARGRTVILITHRLASVRNCDRIYLLHEGALVEQGTHDSLIAQAGRYAELYALQARMYETPWRSLQPH
jgi:ATP-binding cassette subfamily B protein